MAQGTFLLLALALFNLHLAQATTCKGDNCPTGLVITGGEGAETSIETFPADCSIPPFPGSGREGHSLSVISQGKQLVACGGTKTPTSCISWQHGQEGWNITGQYGAIWKDFHTLSKKRNQHAAVVMQDDVIVIVGGGGSSKTTGEIVPSGTVFNLQNSGSATCAVKFKRDLFMIGGSSGSRDSAHGKVDRYDSQGKYLGSLPDLGTARWFHACATFTSSNGEEGLLVAGGSDTSDNELSTTEVYLSSTGRWTSGENLPRALYDLRAARLNQRVVVTGGANGGKDRDEVLQYNIETGAWTQMDKTMRIPRRNHAIVEANLATLCSGATTTTGLDPLLALLIGLFLLCCRGCNNSCTLQGENKQSL